LQNQFRHPGHQFFSKMTIMPSSSTPDLTITGAAINRVLLAHRTDRFKFVDATCRGGA
jgi:hypothetical protein